MFTNPASVKTILIGRVLFVSAVALAAARALVASTVSACSPTIFVEAATYPTTDYPNAVTVGDFNNDGKLDVVSGGNPVVVLPGDGLGAFGSPVSSPLTLFTRFLVAADFDGDGNLDLASGDSTVDILLGNGDGTFQLGSSYGTGSSATGFAAADINGDGIVDLVETSMFYTNALFVLIGKGDGTFFAPVSYPVEFYPRAVATGDFNEDGRSDVAVALDDGTLAIYSGLPDGTLTAPTSVPVGDGLHTLAAADLDGNGHFDLIAGRDAYLDVFRGNGDGSFQAGIETPSPGPTTVIAVVDVDGDGRLDLAELQPSFSYASSRIVILRQSDDGNFEGMGAFQAAAATTPAMTSGDFDGDGRADFAVTSDQSGTVTIALALPGGLLEAVQAPRLPGQPRVVVSGDFDGDGTVDLAALNVQYAGAVTVLARDARGAFAPGASIPVGAFNVAAMIEGDFDLDGRPDLAVGDYDGTISILKGTGAGTFTAFGSYATGTGGIVLVAGDFNGDGIPDLASAGTYGQPGTVWLLIGNGDGTFTPPVAGPEPFLWSDRAGRGRPQWRRPPGSRRRERFLLHLSVR